MIMIIMVILEIMMVIITVLVIIVIIIINKRSTGDGMLLQFQFIISTKQTDSQFY